MRNLISAGDHHRERVIGGKITREFLAASVRVLIQWLPLRSIRKE